MVIYSEVQPSETTENTFRIETTLPTTHKQPSQSIYNFLLHDVNYNNIIPYSYSATKKLDNTMIKIVELENY